MMKVLSCIISFSAFIAFLHRCSGFSPYGMKTWRRHTKADLRKMKMSNDRSDYEKMKPESNKFDKMRSFESRLHRIEKMAPEFLEMFYEPHLRSFSVFPGLSEVRIILTLNHIFALSFKHENQKSCG